MFLRRMIAAVALLCVLVSPVHAQKSKATLTTEVNTNWPDNAVGTITPAVLRTTVLDIVNSYVDWLTCTGTGGVVYWSGGTPTCLSAGTNGQFLTQSAGVPAWANIASTLIAGTGITITGTISPTIALTNQITAGGPTGSATQAPIITYNAQGQLTAVLSATVTPAVGSVTSVLSNSIVGNNTGATANALSLTAGQVGAMLCLPQRSVFTSGTNTTYTTPTCNGVTATRIEFEMVGGGGGGAGSGTTPGAAVAGGDTCWKSSGTACSSPDEVAHGGALGVTTTSASAVGGTASGCDLNLSGGVGGPAVAVASTLGGIGGASFFGGQGVSSGLGSATGQAAAANTGSGGSGAADGATVNSGGGGGAGGYCRKLISSPAASYVYTVGALGTAGTAGGSGFAGGAGGAGLVIVTAYWQ